MSEDLPKAPQVIQGPVGPDGKPKFGYIAEKLSRDYNVAYLQGVSLGEDPILRVDQLDPELAAFLLKNFVPVHAKTNFKCVIADAEGNFAILWGLPGKLYVEPSAGERSKVARFLEIRKTKKNPA